MASQSIEMFEGDEILKQGIQLEDIGSKEQVRKEEPAGQQVDVEKAKEDFNKVNDALATTLSSDINGGGLLEETKAHFDLRDWLEDSQRNRDKEGFKRKRMGVVFKNLTVVGEGADASRISNLWTPIETAISYLNPVRWFKKTKLGTDFDIIHNVTGFCKDGEMLLVLGRPGAGCSTFLRVIANQTASYKAITGDVTYGGIVAEDFEMFAGEAIYTAEEDVHFPSLTVNQTLQAAIRCKVPHRRISNVTRKSFQAKLQEVLLTMFGLKNQANTVVGNEIIRGLSGGERKRLTIAEAMTAQAAINCWDCTTRGLDAASALDYTRALRILSDVLSKTTIATFYQASEDMYALFDKVMLLDKGRCIYFGPGAFAKQYFEDMGYMCEPRKSTPDFLTGITNPNERKIQPGFESQVPRTPAQMEDYYLSSPLRRKMDEELAAYEQFVEDEQPHRAFRDHVRDTKATMMSRSSIYTTNFVQQTRVLIKREFQLISGDRGALFGKVFSVISKSFIYSTVFLFMGLDTKGALTRGGALFASMLFNALISLSELPSALRGRRILQKHKSYAMYRPSAYHIATVVSDIPITFVQVFLFAICAYFLFGFQLLADKFFIFTFTLVVAVLTMTELFRLIGNISSSYFMASQMANVVLVILLTYTGFLVPYKQMHPWFGWIYWVNPLAYAYKCIFINEMQGLIFPCEGYGAVPFGPAYTNTSAMACTLPGQRGTELFVRGENYLEDAYGYETSQKILDGFAVLLFWLFYIGLNCLAMEFLELNSGGYTRQVFKKGKAPKQNDAFDNTQKEQEEVRIEGIDASEKTTFTWQDVKYTVPVKGGKRVLLDHVEGWIKPGQMTALMGSSGAGKTTLLDVLAKRKTIGKIEGQILLNGDRLRSDFERLTGYVEQMDVHQPGQTVREALRFSARMRQDPSIPLEDKYDYVETVLNMMEMTDLGDALIGDLESGRGISVEERKRLTIGMELVGKPKILFLDEPTSGLDAQSSYNIVKFIRKLADAGMPLVCTIHQPSSVLFEHFDRLLLLARGGKTVYFGDIGERSRSLINYFEKNGADIAQESENPAEYILRAIGAGTAQVKNNTIDWPEVWKQSKECAQVHHELENAPSAGASTSKASRKLSREFATSGKNQFWEVYKRMNLVWWRDPLYNYGRILNAIFIGLINGFSFYQLSSSKEDLQARVFAIFMVLILANSLITLAQPMLMRQRVFFRKEYASKFYGWWPFALSIVLTELPHLAITSAIFVFVTYWTAGLESTASRGIYFYLMFVMFNFFAVSFGQAIAAFCATIVQAAVLNPFFTPMLILFAGVLCPPASLPKFWKSWMYPLDPYHYFLEGIVTDVLYDVNVVCRASELTPIPLDSAFATCADYMKTYFQYPWATGYLQNPESTDICNYCQYSKGQEFYANFEWSYDDRWRNFGVLTAFFIFNIFLVILFTYLYRKPKR